MIAGDQLRLSLRQIERQTVGLGKDRNYENDGADGLGKDIPPWERAEPGARLSVDDLLEVQGARAHQHPYNRNRHRELVGDRLRGGADASVKGELVVRRTTPQGQTEYTASEAMAKM